MTVRLELTRRTDLALPALARSGALRKGGELAETPGTAAVCRARRLGAGA
jgi:hypothetical protein